MFEDFKTFLCLVGLVFAGGIVGYLMSCVFRSKADRRTSSDNAERNERIQSGIAESEAGIDRAESHIDRAEGILREAIKQSREESK